MLMLMLNNSNTMRGWSVQQHTRLKTRPCPAQRQSKFQLVHIPVLVQFVQGFVVEPSEQSKLQEIRQTVLTAGFNDELKL
jgi:hypothetical protein